MARSPNRAGIAATSLFAVWLTLGCSEPTVDGHQVGLLLPRTGQLADSGGHAESGAVMAAERINLAGGVAGNKPLVLFIGDTRSDPKAGAQAARNLLDAPLLGIVGPEEEAIAAGLAIGGREKQVVQISGGVTSPTFTTMVDGGFFFRTCPTSLVTATAISRRMIEDGVRRLSLLYVQNDFGSSFASSVAVAFQAAGGELVAEGTQSPISVQPGRANFREVLTPLLTLKPDALLLVTDPVTGVKLVQDWRLLGGAGRLYFSPALMTDVFVGEAGGLEGMVGVSSLSGAQRDCFAQAYARWAGVQPSATANFYFDGIALLALAAERAYLAAGAVPTGAQVRDALAQVSGPPGEKVRWDELDRGLQLIRSGQEIDYVGASGEIDWDANGDVTAAQTSFWTVRGAAIAFE